MKKALLHPCQYWQPPHEANYGNKTALLNFSFMTYTTIFEQFKHSSVYHDNQ